MKHAPEHLLDSIEKLRVPARLTLEIVTRYYMGQLAPEHFRAAPEELAAALLEIRRALSCRALVSEKLSEDDQAQVLEVLGSHLPTPLPDDEPGSKTDHIDTLIQEVSIGLICWHARTSTTFALFEEGRDRLPDCERSQHGDFVLVRAADWSSYPYNGCTGTFQRYSDPRIGHHARWAVVDLGGQEDDLVFVRPAHLEFAREDEGQEPAISRRPSKCEIEEEVCSEAEALDRHEHFGTWSRNGFTLRLYDTGRIDRLGKSILAYELRDGGFGRTPI